MFVRDLFGTLLQVILPIFIENTCMLITNTNIGSEANVPPAYRYLICNYTIDAYNLKKIKEDVVQFMKKREKNASYSSFINWAGASNEIAVLTMYAYADLEIPRYFNIIFDINNPDNYEETDFKIIIAIMDGYAPFKTIGYGHKHVCILQFEKEIPSILNLLIPFHRDWP